MNVRMICTLAGRRTLVTAALFRDDREHLAVNRCRHIPPRIESEQVRLMKRAFPVETVLPLAVVVATDFAFSRQPFMRRNRRPLRIPAPLDREVRLELAPHVRTDPPIDHTLAAANRFGNLAGWITRKHHFRI